MKVKDGTLHSAFASARYRVIQPMLGLHQRGHSVSFEQCGPETATSELIRKLDGDVIVLSKMISPQRDRFQKTFVVVSQIVDYAHVSGRRVLADINDNYFDHDFFGPYYRELVNTVDGVVTSTVAMSNVVKQHTTRRVSVVTDGFEGPHGEPNFSPPPPAKSRWLSLLGRQKARDRPLRLVWFGHQSNWKSMQAVVEQLPRKHFGDIDIEIITGAGFGVEGFCAAFNQTHGRVCSVHFTPWSLAATWQGLANATAVLIPSLPDDPTKVVKSPNRLVESLRAGRFAVANLVPAYLPLEPFAWLGSDVHAGLHWALERPDEVRERILAGQAFVEANFSQKAIAAAWECVLEQTLAAA